MKFQTWWSLLCLVALPAGAAALDTKERRALRLEQSGPTDNLQVIQEKLAKEADQDKDAYDGLGCWCQENLAAKQQVADNMDSQVTGLSHDIERQSAENARLTMELTSHEKELTDGQQSLDEATAMRQDAASKFASNHQATSQYINQLDDALAVVSRPEHQLGLVSTMRSMLGGASGGSSLFLQVQKKIGGSQSPDVVSGVLKQMRSTFADDLQDMQGDESAAMERHEELAKAKSQEIGAIKRQIATKKQLAANGGLQVARQKELADRLGALRDANAGLLVVMHSFCGANEEAFQGRRDERQAQLVALSSATAAIHGAQLLAVRSTSGGYGFDSGPEELCTAALGIANKTWRAAAQAACEKARAGQTQDAADATEALEGEISAAKRMIEADAEMCREAKKEAAAEHEQASQELDTRANSVNMDKQTAQSQIDDVTQQSSTSEEAKGKLAQLRATQHQVLQGIGLISNNAVELLKRSEAAVPQAAVTKLREAAQASEKLAQIAATFDNQADGEAQKVARALDATTSASAKALITLRLIHADAEEAAVNINEDRGVQSSLSKRGPASCDAAALTTKAQQMGDYLKRLGDAAEGLAFAALR